MKKPRKIKVTSVTPTESSELPPAVLYYPNGVPLETESSRTAILESRTSDQYSILRSEADHNVAFVGKTPDTEVEPLSCNYAIGVFTRRSRSLKLCPLLGDTTIRMEPRIKGLQYKASEETSVTEGDNYYQQQISGNIRAMATFSGTKTKNRLKTSERGRINTSSLSSKAALNAIREDISAKAQEEGLSKEQVFEKSSIERSLPPCHLDATTTEEAYIFQELCPAFLVPSLHPEKYQEALTDERAEMELRKNSESRFVMNLLETLKNEANAKTLNSKLEKLAFLSALLRLNGISKRITSKTGLSIQQTAEDFGFDPSILSFLISTFFEEIRSKGGTQYSFPDGKRNLLIQYILVVSFSANESILDSTVLDGIVIELGITPLALSKLIQSIGAKVTNKSGGTRQWTARLLRNGKSLSENLPRLSQTPSRKRK